MTVIGATKEAEYALLIAADSGQRDIPADVRTLHMCKIRQHSTAQASLAWAFTGNMSEPIEELSNHIRTIAWPPTSWTDFRDDIAGRLADINGAQRDRARRAGALDPEDATASLVVVCWIEATPHIVEFDSIGTPTSYLDRAIYAIGSGSPNAMIALQAYEVINADKQLDRWTLLNCTMAVGTNGKDCSPPVHIFRVTPNGVAPATERLPPPPSVTGQEQS